VTASLLPLLFQHRGSTLVSFVTISEIFAMAVLITMKNSVAGATAMKTLFKEELPKSQLLAVRRGKTSEHD